MKKLLLLFTLLFVFSTNKGKAEDWTDLQHEVSLSYGFMPVWDMLDYYDDYFNPKETGLTFDDKGKFGAINVSYLFYPDENWGIGLVYSYTNNDKNILNKTAPIGTYSYSIHTICPSFKYNWYNYKFVTFYSRVNAGIAIATSNADYIDKKIEHESATKAFFMYQASPIGIELGTQIAGFVEVGFGHMGTVLAGIRYKM